jgi:hypothetical protein
LREYGFTIAGGRGLTIGVCRVVFCLQVGIELKFKDAGYRHMAAVAHVPELSQVRRAAVAQQHYQQQQQQEHWTATDVP